MRSYVAIAVRISRFRTRRYNTKELALMEMNGCERVSASLYEKVLNEEFIKDITATDIKHLRREISMMVDECAPNPIIVKTLGNNEDPIVKHSFLTGRGYRVTDAHAVLETILYRPKNPELYRQRMEKENKGVAPKRPTEAETAAIREKAIPFLMKGSLKGIGFTSEEDLMAFSRDLFARRLEFADEDQFLNFLRMEFDKQIRKVRGREMVPSSSSASDLVNLSSILNDEMTILCRIIGKESVLVSMYQQYYFNWYDITDPVFSVSNTVDDKLTSTFVYGKDNLGR